jgi:hypothetical protein
MANRKIIQNYSPAFSSDELRERILKIPKDLKIAREMAVLGQYDLAIEKFKDLF